MAWVSETYPGALNITGGTLTTGAWYVGHQTTGTINLSGGSLIANGNQMLFGWTQVPTMNITGGTMSMTGAGTYNIGHGAQSFINVSGNGVANFAGGMNVLNGSQINNNGGTVTINSGSGQQITVQAGSINQTAGTTTVGDNLWLGANALTGTVNLSGGTWNQNNFLRMGVFGSGNGIINQTSGTFAMGSTFEVWAGSKSSYNLNGGTFRVTGTNVKINNASGGMDFNITGSSGNVTVDTGTNNFSTPNTSTFDNAAATLTKIGSGTLTIGGAGSQLQINNGALNMQAGTLETQSTLSIGASNGTASGTMSGGILRTGYLAASNFAVGYGGTGSLTQSSGTVDVGTQANTVIGWNAGGTGTYTLNGGTYSTGTNNTYIGFSGGAGTVNVNGGSFSAYNLIVGGNSAASGTLNLNGGTLSLVNTDGFYVSSNGTLNLNSGGSLPATTLRVSSGGKLNFNGGTGNASLNIIAGGGAGGTVDLNGQTLGNGSWGNLVAGGTGAVLRNSGTTAATIPNSSNVLWIWDGAQNLTIDTPAASLSIASRITSSGQTTATGIIKTGTGTLTLSGANDYTGSTAVNAGTLQITNGNALGSTAGGTVVADGARLILGQNSAGVTVGNEALTISGTGNAGWALRASNLSTSTWGGKITLAANAGIQAGTGSSLTLDVASGDAIDLGSFTATFSGAGAFQINDPISGSGGMAKESTGPLTLNANNTYSGVTTVSGGTLSLGSGGTAGSIAGNVVNNASLVFNRSDAVTYAGLISGNGSVTKQGAGTLTLTGSSTFSGPTAISSGTLAVNGSVASAVNVANAAILGGAGTINGLVTVAGGGILAPGNSPGTLTMTSGLSLADSSILNFELGRHRHHGRRRHQRPHRGHGQFPARRRAQCCRNGRLLDGGRQHEVAALQLLRRHVHQWRAHARHDAVGRREREILPDRHGDRGPGQPRDRARAGRAGPCRPRHRRRRVGTPPPAKGLRGAVNDRITS